MMPCTDLFDILRWRGLLFRRTVEDELVSGQECRFWYCNPALLLAVLIEEEPEEDDLQMLMDLVDEVDCVATVELSSQQLFFF